jgi:hypothetical protein
VHVGSILDYTIPDTTFRDLEKNYLSYGAKYFNILLGQAQDLPTWLKFD